MNKKKRIKNRRMLKKERMKKGEKEETRKYRNKNKRDGKIEVRKSGEEKNKEIEARKIARLSIYTSWKKGKSERLKTQERDDGG